MGIFYINGNHETLTESRKGFCFNSLRFGFVEKQNTSTRCLQPLDKTTAMIAHKRLKNRLSIVALLLCIGMLCISAATTSKPPIAPAILTGRVIAITDGDTFKLVTQDSVQHIIRVAHIDCPEKKQAYSKRAKQFTSNALFGKTVAVTILNKDRYGRYIGDVAYNKQRSLSEALLIHGLAWHYKKYSKDPALQALENQARAEKRGLWQDSQAIAPWEWRSKKRKKTP